MTLLSRMISTLKSTFSAQPCPHWADYLQDTADK